jgi:HK97 family phage portal protein
MIWPFSIFQRKRVDDNPFYREFFGSLESQTGISVTWKAALEAVTALACARVIGHGLAQAPCKVFREESGKKLPAKDHSLFDLVDTGPNPFQTSFEYFEQMGFHLLFCGNSYSYINRYKDEIGELLPYEPNVVSVKKDGWEQYYTVTDQKGKTHDIQASDMWHVRGPSWNGYMGLDGVRLAREAIGLSLATEKHGARTFRNGAHIGGVLQSDQQNPGKEKTAEIREAWHEIFGGTNNAGKTAVLWHGLKYAAVQMMNDQAQFLETRKFQVEEVCRAFGVMPIMVGYSDKTATYASAEQMFLAHVVHCLGPWYRRVETSAKKFLLTKKERMDGYYIKFNERALLRGSMKDEAEYFAKALGSGGSPPWLTQDEVRDLCERNPMGGTAAMLREPTNVGGPTGGENVPET